MQRLMSVAQVLDWYSRSQLREYSPKALQERNRLFGLFRKEYGECLVSECCAGQLLEFIAAQKSCKSNWTRKRIRATIYRPFNHAADNGLIDRNPFRGIKLPRCNHGRDWTDEEYQAVLRHSNPAFRRLVVFCRVSGARPGEARGSQWGQATFKADCLVLREHKTAHLSEKPRRIYYNPVLVKLLGWLKRNRASNSTNILLNTAGTPWTMGCLVKYMIAVRKRAGLAADVRLHGLRHTFATHALMNGVDLRTVADLIGHATTQSTQWYVHLVDKSAHLNDAAAKAIKRAM